MAVEAPLLNAHPARTQPRGGAPDLGSVTPSARGPALWSDHCAACHGETGAGDGPAAEWLLPRPTNLTSRQYAPARVADALWNGVYGTSMPAWRDHALEDLAALVSVVRGLAAPDAEPAPTADELAVGGRVYAASCAPCHGETGAGDGFAAGELAVAPTDFRGQRPTVAEALRALREGVAGTRMAPWTDRLDETELLAAAHYVRSLYRDVAAAGGSR